MSEQRPITGEVEVESGDATGLAAGKSQPERTSERSFNDGVIDTAQHYGWRTFHLRDKDSMSIVRGRGFPDLVMFRENQETGDIDLVVAELKRQRGIEPTAEQKEWLKAFGRHVPTRTWYPEDWDEIDEVLQNGPADRSVTGQAAAESENGPIPPNFGDIITNVIEAIEATEMRTGEKAGLRRMDPGKPDIPVFWKLLSQRGMSPNPDIGKWGLIMHGIALMAHTNVRAHDPRRRIGQTLYEGRGDDITTRALYSNDRLSTLLSARGPALHRLLGRLFRMLAQERCAFDWRKMAWFILNEGYNEAEADKARIGIARAYYQAERRNAPSAESGNE